MSLGLERLNHSKATCITCFIINSAILSTLCIYVFRTTLMRATMDQSVL